MYSYKNILVSFDFIKIIHLILYPAFRYVKQQATKDINFFYEVFNIKFNTA